MLVGALELFSYYYKGIFPGNAIGDRSLIAQNRQF
jgi:hypothetical protein